MDIKERLQKYFKEKSPFKITTDILLYLLILAMLLWSSSFVALKLAFRGFHPLQVIFGRMFIASS